MHMTAPPSEPPSDSALIASLRRWCEAHLACGAIMTIIDGSGFICPGGYCRDGYEFDAWTFEEGETHA